MTDKKQPDVPHGAPMPEPPVLYTDNVIMTTNTDGVVFDVCQPALGQKSIRVIVRLGMSREHAKKFVVKLSRLLAITEGNAASGGRGKN